MYGLRVCVFVRLVCICRVNYLIFLRPDPENCALSTQIRNKIIGSFCVFVDYYPQLFFYTMEKTQFSTSNR